jgi:type III pantothenate kinase
MRFKAMHHYTAGLPLIEIKESFDVFELVGRNTEESIISGVLHGIRAEIDGIIDSYKENYENLTCIITGGNWSYFAYSLKNKIFAHPNLVLFGLNSILQYNVKEK